MQDVEALSQEELEAELAKAHAELEDVLAMRRAFLGQTGVHIGARIMTSFRRQTEGDEARLRGRIAALEARLQRVGWEGGSRDGPQAP